MRQGSKGKCRREETRKRRNEKKLRGCIGHCERKIRRDETRRILGRAKEN